MAQARPDKCEMDERAHARRLVAVALWPAVKEILSERMAGQVERDVGGRPGPSLGILPPRPEVAPRGEEAKA